MIKTIVKIITSLAIFGCISNQISYADITNGCQAPNCYIQLAQTGQDEGSFIRKNQEAVKSSTNVALFTVYRIKCLNNSNRDGLNACNKALSIKADPALQKRRGLLSARLNPKRPPAVVPKKQPPPRRVVVQQKTKPVVRTPPRVAPPTPRKIVKAVPKQNKEALRKQQLAKQQAKQTVIKIQQLLIKLGFNVSVADGIAGKNTRKAIKRFIELSNSKVSSRTNSKLLSELTKAHKAHLKSNKQYQLAKKQSDEGELNKALKTVRQSLNRTPWHKQLASLKSTIETQIASINDTKQQELSYQTALKKAEEAKAIQAAESQRKLALEKALAEEARSKAVLKKIEEEKQIAADKKLEEEQRLREKTKQKELKRLELERQIAYQKEIKAEKERLKQQALKKLEQEKQLALQEKLRQQTKDRQINQIISKAQTELLQHKFDISLQTVTKGLLLSPESPKILQLKDKILLAQDQYQLDQKLRKITDNVTALLNANDYDKAELLITEGLALAPNHPTLKMLKTKLVVDKENASKLAELLAKSQKLFKEGNFEDAIEVTSMGLIIDPNHTELLKIQDKITEKIEQLMFKVSLKKQKVSNLLALIKGKERDLLDIEKKINSEKKQLLIKAQKTLKKYWITQNTQ